MRVGKAHQLPTVCSKSSRISGAVYEFLLQEDEMQHLASNLRGVDGAGHNNVLPFSQKVSFPLEKGLEVLKYLGIV